LHGPALLAPASNHAPEAVQRRLRFAEIVQQRTLVLRRRTPPHRISNEVNVLISHSMRRRNHHSCIIPTKSVATPKPTRHDCIPPPPVLVLSQSKIRTKSIGSLSEPCPLLLRESR